MPFDFGSTTSVRLENYRTEPNIFLDDRPEEYVKGGDRQPEETFSEAITVLEKNSRLTPRFGPTSDLALPG